MMHPFTFASISPVVHWYKNCTGQQHDHGGNSFAHLYTLNLMRSEYFGKFGVNDHRHTRSVFDFLLQAENLCKALVHDRPIDFDSLTFFNLLLFLFLRHRLVVYGWVV